MATGIGQGGEISKIKDNLDELETLKKIQKEGRELATDEGVDWMCKTLVESDMLNDLREHLRILELQKAAPASRKVQ